MTQKEKLLSIRSQRFLAKCILLAVYFLVANFVYAGPNGKYKIKHFDYHLFQRKPIQGKVINSNGDPLIGATVHLKGSNVSVTTKEDGLFSIEAEVNSILEISYVGMETKEVPINKSTSFLSVQLESVQNALSDVVVVGYGTQKKVNLTGSVSSVSSKTLLERPATNAANLLQGRISGLRVTQPSGQPGRDDGSLEIRGLGSFGASSAPLVLVDGVIGSISNVAPNDIENITVLKDAASASIYGARAANGVILITTKTGTKGATVIEYKLDAGSQSATRLPDLVYNTAEYMKLYNSAATRSGLPTIYTQQQIDAYANAKNDPNYPNFNWMDYYFNPAASVNNYLSISGSSDKSAYRFSMNYLNEDGILPNIKYKRYNAQLNFTNQVTKAIQIGTNIGMVYKDNSEPPGGSDVSALALAVIQNGPDYSPYLPDGSGRLASVGYPNERHNATSPVVFSNGRTFTKQYGLNAQAFVNVNLFKGLTWSTKVAVNYNDNTVKDWRYATLNHYYFQKLPGDTGYTVDPTVTSPGPAGVTDSWVKSITPTIYSTLTYQTKISNDNNINVMLGSEQESNKTSILGGNKSVFPVTSLMELNAGGINGQSVNGTAYEWALRSYFGRLTYNYKGKYLLEANARYDGTSRVSEKYRWGLFPSVSAGWKISEEKFMSNMTFIDNLKIRASLGTLGNQEIGNYPYQDILNFTQYAFGGSNISGVQLNRLSDQSLRWETTRILDFGLDMDIYKQLLGITFDWFKKNTTNILAQIPVPSSLGLRGPTSNNGELQNIGWEVELRHANRIGQFTYSTNLLFSTFKNKLLSIVTPTKGIRQVGLPYNSYYLYQMIGIFQSQDEIDKSPKQIFRAPKPGEIKIKDQNGDGIIDANDRVSYSPYPDFTYSFDLNMGYKAFDLSVFLQGVSGIHARIYGWGWDPFVQGDPPLKKFLNAWTPTNPSNTIPAVYIGGGGSSGNGGPNVYTSTYDLQNASYLRVKSIKLSYSFPSSITDKIKSKGLTLYLSGDNLFTFTKYPGMDPERPMDGPNGGRGFYYPQVKILNVGVDVKF